MKRPARLGVFHGAPAGCVKGLVLVAFVVQAILKARLKHNSATAAFSDHIGFLDFPHAACGVPKKDSR